MTTIVVGGGDLAAHLVEAVEARGHEVELITPHTREAEEFALTFPEILVFAGDARDVEVLRRARASEADCLVAATDDDATNLTACLLAREVFGVRTVTGLVGQRRNAYTFETLGIPYVSCSEVMAAGLLSAVDGRVGSGAR